jgi:hypothetical protein
MRLNDTNEIVDEPNFIHVLLFIYAINFIHMC